ncbi:hypothetical protein EWM64_g8015 [Hericium alpestre]|uniref:Membrane-associated proteins in eicosanoid and glutathione metabolism n=1 Tax=Hericium alpestre TaxID=135208 RepID=A0A4Y9ZR71_9AGAM|nr:hypothetical protein EWM64_g8015 [Hericium alpestre]
MPLIEVPQGFGYVAASLLSTALILQWQGFVVGSARKSAAVPYPQMYAEKAEAQNSKTAMIFNCKQRAHQNTLEHMPAIIIMSLIAGAKYPLITAASTGLWSFSRILYTKGYATGDPKKRQWGTWGELGQLVLLGASGKAVYDWISGGL